VAITQLLVLVRLINKTIDILSMTDTEHEIIDDPNEIEFIGDALSVLVFTKHIDRDYKGTSRGEEYFDETIVDEQTHTVDLPIASIYEQGNPENHKSGSESKQFLHNSTVDAVTVQDIETCIVEIEDTTYVASFDSTPLDEFRM
jgi:hypothetical protein